MSARMLRARRGSALILVLLMTLAVAGLAIAAIFLTSSAGLLSRFYDREREFRLAAESALEMVRSRLLADTSFAIPDTGMVQLLAGHQVRDAAGTVITGVSVNVYAAVTGDTSGRWRPNLTLLAASYDGNGTRHVRRLDLRRESFSRYSLFADQFGSTLAFGPGFVPGRVHTNETWRSGSAIFSATYHDTVTAVVGLAGTGTYDRGTRTGVPRVPYPVDSTYPWLDTLAMDADLSFAPVSGSGVGWRKGSRLEFVAFDADGDATLEDGEGFFRVFDLADGMDTTRLRAGLEATDLYAFGLGRAKLWSDPVVQNQCGAFYYRNSRWHFFPIATHRANWARNVLYGPGSPNYPQINNPDLNRMDDYDYDGVDEIMRQPTARCFPAGSPFLMTTERKTNASGIVTGTAADTVPFGVVTPAGGWPLSAPNGYGGNDTTFTPRSITCLISSGGTSGRCDTGTIATLGTWRTFGGTAVSGVATTIRQPEELAYLWPFGTARNAASRGVAHVAAGPIFVSGQVRGNLTLHVDGAVQVITRLTYANDPADPATPSCTDQLGVLAVGDVLVADNGLLRGRRIARSNSSFDNFAGHYGAENDLALHATLMSLTGSVRVENNSVTGVVAQPCPHDAGSTNSGAGCLRVGGGMVMRSFSQVQSGSNTGYRYYGSFDRCQATTRRPPFFPLTNRYEFVRSLEIEPSLANTPARIRAILMRLKGRTL